MASRKSKPERKDAASAGSTAWKQRFALHGMIAAVVVTGCITAVVFSRDYVEQTVAAPKVAPTIVFKSTPAWMTPLVAQQLSASFTPRRPRSVFDRDVLVETTRLLRGNPWIAKVRQVRRVYRKAPGDAVEIDCEFRAPMALVRAGNDYWFADAHGVKLPERFGAADLPKIVYLPDGRTNLRVIDGVRHAPPKASGEQWPGEDLTAGLDLITRLYDQACAQEIVGVNVANFAGRIDPREAQIVLTTRYGTEVRWGRPWRASDSFIEVPPERKVEYMRRVVADFGRVDAHQRWIDIRFDKVTYPSPGAESAAQADGTR